MTFPNARFRLVGDDPVVGGTRVRYFRYAVILIQSRDDYVAGHTELQWYANPDGPISGRLTCLGMSRRGQQQEQNRTHQHVFEVEEKRFHNIPFAPQSSITSSNLTAAIPLELAYLPAKAYKHTKRNDRDAKLGRIGGQFPPYVERRLTASLRALVWRRRSNS